MENIMSKTDYERLVDRSVAVQQRWSRVPAPKRGELIRVFGDLLRSHIDEIARSITSEAKKIIAESIGEVQEAIDMCDYAVGQSRQLYGLTMPSERSDHHLREMWHPLGVVGVITAFNFPVAVWAWNHCLAIVCGNSVVWKGSPKTTSTTLLCKKIWDMSVDKLFPNSDFHDLLLLIEGHNEVAERLADDRRIALLSATGSTEMGRNLAPRAARRLGKTLFELGGNNAMVLSQHARLDLATRAMVFSAVGTCGQRCTTLRRLFVHDTIHDDVAKRLEHAYTQLVIGDPFDHDTLVGPLIDDLAVTKMMGVLAGCRDRGYEVFGGEHLSHLGATYVSPTIVYLPKPCELTKIETFAPILYVMPYSHIEDAITMDNSVDQGLSSCIFTDNIQEAELFCSSQGSDCGIVNVNIGPSGVEIGGAFGGEKDTGGGRESGSDAWKSYMRRAIVTVNYADAATG